MNGDSDESEYVDDDEHLLSEPDARRKSSKAKIKNFRVKNESSRETSAPSEELLGGAHVKRDGIAKPKTAVLRAYRDLLNAEIAEVFEPAPDDGSNALAPSQIGASIWTSQEKHRFFTALPSFGPGNLPCISRAVGTKSEFEVKAYVLLLQEGARELDEKGKAREKFHLSDVPAAAEISEECLDVEEACVAELDRRVKEQEMAVEKEWWGEENWLIDEDAAAAIEAASVDASGKPIKPENSADDEVVDPDPAHYDASDAQHDSTSSQLSSDLLLNPSNFLQLSRSIFMNSKNPELDWRTVFEDDEISSSPSMRRTAFEDFYNLTVSITRRLVQASIFQALSRLRSSSDKRYIAAVSKNDVEAAREMAGPKMEGRKYWADAVRRCGIEVYCDSRKIRGDDGRIGTKVGYRLTQSEVEAALGIRAPNGDGDASATINSDESDASVNDSDSDAYTIASSSDAEGNEQSDPELKEAEVSRGRTKTPSENHKRPLSPTSFDRAERGYLEKFDRINSTGVENDLRAVLGLEALPEAPSPRPAFNYKRSITETKTPDWREMVQYEAPWEQPQGHPSMSDIERMESKGARRRKRRRVEPEAILSPREEPMEVSEDEGGQELSEEETNRDTAEKDSEEDEDGSKDNSGDEAEENDVDIVESDEE